MGGMVKGGYGGGIPVVAFWTGHVGEAVGHVETIPIPAAIPAKVATDGRVNTEVDYRRERHAEARRDLFHSAQFSFGLCRRFL